MVAIVEEIEQNSIAEDLNITKGDKIIKINNVVPKDLIDYKYLINDEEIEIEIQKTNGEIQIIEIEKDFNDDLGIIFENAVFDKIKKCQNKCIFCFVDQQPKGLRKSLYVKDDDYRLSYLQGTYITLTNLTEEDKQRITSLNLGPLYISLHTTNPELRAEMLNNSNAADIIEQLNWLKKLKIPIHLQIVLCPNYNDGVELQRTLTDLQKFKSIILSIAIVPVGLTKFRKKQLQAVDKKCALNVIAQIDDFNKKIKKNIACASDEFFIMADAEIPPRSYYSNFAQLADGVGALRLLLDDFEKNKKKLPKLLETPKTLHLICAPACKKVFSEIQKEFNKIKNLEFVLLDVNGEFFGDNITVAGLITGSDIIHQVNKFKNSIKTLILPSIMLRPFSQTFLDGKTVQDVELSLDCQIVIVNDIYSTKEIIDYIK